MPGIFRRIVQGAVSLLVRAVLVLVVIEGTASWVGFALALPSGVRPPERERLHMQYDPELGWAHIPGTKLENFYGTGRHLTIGRQGFRSTSAVSPEAQAERSRVVCAGGELTLGVGVGDADTWCARLGARDTGLETINMGQGGYGLDQSFLWFRRDGPVLGPKLVIFAFTREEFARMERDSLGPYGKPTLRLASSGELQARNVPVPRQAGSVPWLVRNLPLFEQLRIVQLARPAFSASWSEQAPRLTMGELAALSTEVFESLQRLTLERGATLVLVYLPSRSDHGSTRDLWRRRMAQEARQRGIPFVDLVDELNEASASEVEALFAASPASDLAGEEPVLSEAGHAWVAKSLATHLRRLPEVVAVLDRPTIP